MSCQNCDLKTLPKIKTIRDLMQVQQNVAQLIELREIELPLSDTIEEHTSAEESSRHDSKQLSSAKAAREMLVCGGTGCHSSASLELMDELRAKLTEHDIDYVKVIQVGCFGFCAQGPIVKVMPDNVFYVQVKPEDADELITQHVLAGEHVERLLFTDPNTEQKQHRHDQMDFYRKQKRIALRNCGAIDPENLMEFIAIGGFQGLAKALHEMTPDEVIQTLKDSGLRGRGGGGFPTGLKWQLCREAVGDQKYIICNADEGDPGAFMDRSILEGDPGSVIESMAIAGYAIGSDRGIIYIRAEYPLAVHRLQTAIDEARAMNLLGENILASGFNFDIELSLGAGAFVCGEETALIHSVEGQRGEPTRKPPFPAVSGYLGKPTNVNNVETYVNVPVILLKGADWYNQIGTESSKGTKVFALAGKVNNIGLVEVPMGTTLREIIYDIGGGIHNDREFKAVQTGGPSGGVITAVNLDTKIDYESLKQINSMMGSGGMIVMDEDNDMVEIAKFYLEFTTEESCGKCTPCRIGTQRVLEILNRLLRQEADEQTLHDLDSLCHTISDSALCGLGQTAPNPVLSTMKYFPEEYLRYARKEVKNYYEINAEKCIGCTRCSRVCPVSCISGKVKEAHVIDIKACIACGACYKACPVDAIIKP